MIGKQFKKEEMNIKDEIDDSRKEELDEEFVFDNSSINRSFQ